MQIYAGTSLIIWGVFSCSETLLHVYLVMWNSAENPMLRHTFYSAPWQVVACSSTSGLANRNPGTVDFHSLRIVWSRIPAPYSAIHCTSRNPDKCNPLYGAGIRDRTIRSEWKSTAPGCIGQGKISLRSTKCP